MKVYYPGPDRKTYHPKLGKLIMDREFELADDVARPYVKGGLLRETEGAKRKAQSVGLKAEGEELKE